MIRHILSIVVLCAFAFDHTAYGQTFQGIGDLPGGTYLSLVSDVSADGSTVVGSSQSGDASEAFRWVDGQIQPLGSLGGLLVVSTATAVSADGSVVVGASRAATSGNQMRAFRWEDGVMVELGWVPEYNVNQARGVSGDGSIIAGWTWDEPLVQPRVFDIRPFRWTPESGTQTIADYGEAHGVSGDGSTIVGFQPANIPGCTEAGFILCEEATRWVEGTASGLGVLGSPASGPPESRALDASEDGSVVVGWSTYSGGQGYYAYEAVRWSEEDGLMPLGLMEEGGRSEALAVSADGSTVVGRATVGSAWRAVIWTEADSLRLLATVLEDDFGIDLDGWTLTSAEGVSADGRVIVGNGTNPSGQLEGWRVVIEPSGLVVNDTGDGEDLVPGDGFCDADPDAFGFQCTLRAALQEANALPGPDEIGFDLDGPAPYVISPESSLPVLGDNLELDATTQPGWIDAPLVRIDGSNAGPGVSGLIIDGDNVTVRGFMITGFDAHGVLVSGGSGGLLETLIVGSDASGAEGMGNNGDGIHMSGGTDWTIGSEAGAGKAGSTAINIGSVISVGNLLNGLYAANASNAALIRSDVRAVEVREGAAAKGAGSAAQAVTINLNVQKLIVGSLDALGDTVALPNGQNGVCLLGISDATFRDVVVGDATMNAFEITASQRIFFQRVLAGMRRPMPTSQTHIGSIGGSIFKLFESREITVGSENASEPPVQGVAAGGWFMDAEDSEYVNVWNAMAGLSANMDALSSPLQSIMRNMSGGVSIRNTPFATIGRTGVPTILANNGGNASMPQAGLFASGELSDAFRALNLHLGTTPTGLAGIGNLGSGIVLADGIRDAFLGGENPFERVVSAGNMGYGYLFRDVGSSIPAKGGERILTINATRLVSDLVPLLGGEVTGLPNALSGFCMLRAKGIRMNMFSAGPSGRHGIESIDSSDLEMLLGSIGSLFEKTIESPADLMGPAENGVSIVGGSRIALGGPLGAPISDLVNMVINNVGGRGVMADGVERLDMSNLGVGVDLLGTPESQAVLAGMGSVLEGIWVRNSIRASMRGLHLLGNGAQSPSGVGGVLVESSSKVDLMQSLLGELNESGSPERPNIGTAIKGVFSDSLLISLNRIVGHQTGVESENSSTRLEDNRLDFQGLLGGIGNAVTQLGGAMAALRNTVSDNTGAAFAIQEAGSSIIRFNNIAGNAIGVAAAGIESDNEPSRVSKSSAAGDIFAPDNWWGDVSGPGGAGPGDGDAISEGVVVDSWLTSPYGIRILPEKSFVEVSVGASVDIGVLFATPSLSADVIVVTVSDERGWVTSEASFEVEVAGLSGASRDIGISVGDDGVERVTIHASSMNDPTLNGEAVIVLAPPETVLPLESAAVAGADRLDAGAEGTLIAGGEIIVNPGGANEETATISGFGSIILSSPLRFDHAAGEKIVPANTMAMETSARTHAHVPSEWGMEIYPNPVRRTVRVRIEAPVPSSGRIELFDLLGRRIVVISDRELPVGRHDLTLDVTDIPPGVYVARGMVDGRVLSSLVTVVR